MKRILTFLFAFLSVVELSAQVPVTELSLSDMTFVRQSFERHFYDSRLEYGRIRLEGVDLFLQNSSNLVTEGDDLKLNRLPGKLLVSAESSGAGTIRVSAFHPFLCYEISFAGLSGKEEVGISFYANDLSSSTLVTYKDGAVQARKSDAGDILASANVPASDAVSLRVQYTGKRFHVFNLTPDGEFSLLFSVEADMSAASSCVTHSFGVYANLPADSEVELLKAESYLSNGTGQADPQVVLHKDGRPYIKDGRLYVCFTTRGFEQIPDSYQGVYSVGISNFDLRLEGALFFGEQDGLMHGYHATKVVYDDDEDRFLVITTSHGGDHTLAWASSSSDILHGMHYLECKELVFPHSFSANPKFNTEDPDFFFDDGAGKWRLAYCAVIDGSYVTFLTESDEWNGPYRQIARSEQNNNTGIRITEVGGRRYVLSGGSGTTFYIYDYPSLAYVGTFRQKYDNGGFRGWPTIVPLPYGNYERYLWITFDRGAITGRYSYGTLYFFLGDSMFLKY